MEPEPSSILNLHKWHCVPAVIVAVGKFGRLVSDEAMTRLLATNMPLQRITRTLLVKTVGDGDSDILWHIGPDETESDPADALARVFDEVLDANALEAVRDVGGIVDTGRQIKTLVIMIGDCEDALFAEALDAVSSAVATRCDESGARIHLVPVLAVPRPNGDSGKAIPPCLRELMTQVEASSASLPRSMSLTAYVADCRREDGSHIETHALAQALAHAVYITLAPSQAPRTFLLHGSDSPTGGRARWRSLGVSSLLVPFGAIKRAIRARLGAELLEHSLLAPEEAPSSNRDAAAETGVADRFAEANLFAAAFDGIPVKAEYSKGQPILSIDPSYSSELHRNIRSTDAMQWADRIADFDAAVGRIYLPEWLSTLSDNVAGFIERARTELASGVLALLQSERETLHAARALLEQAREALSVYHLPQLRVEDIEQEREHWRQELNEAIEQCPNQYALAARLLLAAAVGGYAFWHALLALRLPEQIALVIAAVLALGAAIAYFWLTLAHANTRLIQARESYLRGISTAHSTLLLSRLSAHANHAQSSLKAAIDGLARDLDGLEQSAGGVRELLAEEGSSLALTKSPTECSIVADSDLRDLYDYQEFDLHRLAIELIRWPLLDERWANLGADALQSRLSDFAGLHASRLQFMDFELFARRRFGDETDSHVDEHLRRLARQSVVLAPGSLISQRDEPEFVAVVSPRGEAIARTVEQVGSNVGADETYREEKYCITVFRTRNLSLQPEE